MNVRKIIYRGYKTKHIHINIWSASLALYSCSYPLHLSGIKSFRDNKILFPLSWPLPSHIAAQPEAEKRKWSSSYCFFLYITMNNLIPSNPKSLSQLHLKEKHRASTTLTARGSISCSYPTTNPVRNNTITLGHTASGVSPHTALGTQYLLIQLTLI